MAAERKIVWALGFFHALQSLASICGIEAKLSIFTDPQGVPLERTHLIRSYTCATCISQALVYCHPACENNLGADRQCYVGPAQWRFLDRRSTLTVLLEQLVSTRDFMLG